MTTHNAVSTFKAAAFAKDIDIYAEIKDICLMAKELKTHDHCYWNFTRGYTKKDRESAKTQEQEQDQIDKEVREK